MMAKFEITWIGADGTEIKEIVNQSDRDTVEGYIDCRFGASYDPKKAKVRLVGDKAEEPAPAPKPASKKK
jgi:hypothetical protein